MAGDRLAKVIARAGLCSRREAEQWIAAGRVAVNGSPVRTPAFNVTDRDRIEVDGAPLAGRYATRLWLYHKPAGLVVTEKDPEGRPTVFAKLAEEGLPRVVSVGRLDINTEGLLLLTNDGGLKRVLELPETGWLRRYRVRAHGTITQTRLDELKRGFEHEGIRYGSIDAQIEREQGSNVWINVALREGKNREIKRVLGALGLEVNRLIRVSFGPFQLGDLKVGEVDTVPARVLRDQLGKKLAEAAGADFDSPLPETATPEKPAKSNSQRRGDRSDDRGRPARGDSRGAPRREGGGHRRDDRRDDRRGNDRGRFDRNAESDRPVKTRRVFFDDGRPPETIEVPDDKPRGRGRGDKPGFAKGGKPRRDGEKPRREGEKPRFDKSGGRDDRPRRDGKPSGGRPGGKPFGARGDDRPRRDGAKPGGKPSGRGGPPRGNAPRGGARPGGGSRSGGPRKPAPGKR